jgi:hypothetical protein
LCIPKNLNLGQRDRELKYIQAAANSVMAVVIVSKTTFFTRDIDVSKVSIASISLRRPMMQRASAAPPLLANLIEERKTPGRAGWLAPDRVTRL